MKKQMIIAKCDASYKEFNNGVIYIGLGLTIECGKKLCLRENLKFDLTQKHSSTYAELMGIIEILKRLQKYNGENIMIVNDSRGLFKVIKKGHNSPFVNRYHLEIQFAKFLLRKLKENNEVILQWQERRHTRACDELSKKTEEYRLEYELVNGQTGMYICQAVNNADAQEKLKAYVDSRNRIIKGEKLAQNQSKNAFRKMLKQFKKEGVAYA